MFPGIYVGLVMTTARESVYWHQAHPRSQLGVICKVRTMVTVVLLESALFRSCFANIIYAKMRWDWLTNMYTHIKQKS